MPEPLIFIYFYILFYFILLSEKEAASTGRKCSREKITICLRKIQPAPGRVFYLKPPATEKQAWISTGLLAAGVPPRRPNLHSSGGEGLGF